MFSQASGRPTRRYSGEAQPWPRNTSTPSGESALSSTVRDQDDHFKMEPGSHGVVKRPGIQRCPSPFHLDMMNLATGLLLGLFLISPICSFPLTVANGKAFKVWLRSYINLPLDGKSRQYLDDRNNTAVFLCLRVLENLESDPKDSEGYPKYAPRTSPKCTKEELERLWSRVPELLPDLLAAAAFIPTYQIFSPHQSDRQQTMVSAAASQDVKDAKIHVFSPSMPGYSILGISTSLLTMVGKADEMNRYVFNSLPGHGLGVYADRRKIILSDQFGTSWNDQLAELLADPGTDDSITCSQEGLERIQPGASVLALWINSQRSVIEVRSIGRPLLRPCLVVATQAGIAKLWPLVGDDCSGWVPFLQNAYIVFLDDETLSHLDYSMPVYDWIRIRDRGLSGLMWGAIQHMAGLNGAKNPPYSQRPIFGVSLGNTEDAHNLKTTRETQMQHPGMSMLVKRPIIARTTPVYAQNNVGNASVKGDSVNYAIVLDPSPPRKRRNV